MARDFNQPVPRITASSSPADVAACLDKILLAIAAIGSVEIVEGALLTSVSIATGTTQVAHKLGRLARGYIITRTVSIPGNLVCTAIDREFFTFSALSDGVLDLWVFL